MPATAKFLNAVAGLKQGAVVLPGLDTDLDEEAWQTIGGVRDAQGKFTTQPSSNHPQFAMHGLLDRFGIKRPLRYLLFPGNVQNAFSPNWFGVAVPDGITDFTNVVIYFHPTPQQANYFDPDYASKTNGGSTVHANWKELLGYVDRLGSQLAGAVKKSGATPNQIRSTICVGPRTRLANSCDSVISRSSRKITYWTRPLPGSNAVITHGAWPEVKTAPGLSSSGWG
jgi:hypothetical protein